LDVAVAKKKIAAKLVVIVARLFAVGGKNNLPGILGAVSTCASETSGASEPSWSVRPM